MDITFLSDTTFGWIFVIGIIVCGYSIFVYVQRKAERKK
jgi:hypothetical protein